MFTFSLAGSGRSSGEFFFRLRPILHNVQQQKIVCDMQKNLNKNKNKKQNSSKRSSNVTTSKKRSQNQTKKGALSKPVKRQTLKKQANEDGRITKVINAQNEGTFAGVAQNAGGKLSVLKAPLNFDSRSKWHRQSKPFGAGRK